MPEGVHPARDAPPLPDSSEAVQSIRPMHELTPSEVAMAESTASSVCTTNFQVSRFHFMFLKDF